MATAKIHGLIALVTWTSLSPELRAERHVDETFAYSIEVPPGWRVGERGGPGVALLESGSVPGVKAAILAYRKPRQISRKDALSIFAAERKKIEKRTGKVKAVWVPEAPLGRIATFTFSITYRDGDGAPRVVMSTLFGPKAGASALWYHLKVVAPRTAIDDVKALQIGILSSWRYRVPEGDLPGDGSRAEFRHCYVVQKDIALALALSRHAGATVGSLDPRTLAELARQAYLLEVPADPGQGPDSSSNYELTRGRVACRMHGSADLTVEGQLPRPAFDEWESCRILNMRSSDFRACYGMQKSIRGALDIYELDGPQPVTRLEDTVLTALVDRGLLPARPEDPDQGPDSAKNFFLTEGDRRVGCRIHGLAPVRSRRRAGEVRPERMESPEPVTPPSEPARRDAGPEKRVCLRMYYEPKLYIRHRGGQGELSRIESVQDREAAVFRMVDGLVPPTPETAAWCGECRTVSFEAVTMSGHFLVPEGTAIALRAREPGDGFARGASFLRMAGKHGMVSFESMGEPGHYLIHEDGQLRLGTWPLGDDQAMANSAFVILDPP